MNITPEKQRFAFTTEYNGLSYNGFQRQSESKAKKTVQGVIESAFEILFPNEKPTIYGSGRTDAGVHASGQIFHADLPLGTDIKTIEKKLNGLLIKEDVVILNSVPVRADFHARHSALTREYRYTINQKKSALNVHQELFFPFPVDIDYLNQLSKIIETEKDFTSFCKVADVSDIKRCSMKHAYWVQNGTHFYFYIKARRFLYGMVRALVGTQLDFMREGKTVEEFKQIFEKKDRRTASFSAKSYGLNLIKVEYPDELFLVG